MTFVIYVMLQYCILFDGRYLLQQFFIIVTRESTTASINNYWSLLPWKGERYESNGCIFCRMSMLDASRTVSIHVG